MPEVRGLPFDYDGRDDLPRCIPLLLEFAIARGFG